MAHNFIEGLNTITDPTGNTALANHRFFSSDGNDANAGTDPNFPKQNFITANVGSSNVVGGDITLQEMPTSNRTFIGDGMVVADGEGARIIGTSTLSVSLRNFHLRNFTGGALYCENTRPINYCIFENNLLMEVRSLTSVGVSEGMFVKDQDLRLWSSGNWTLRPFVRSVMYSGGARKTFELDLTGVTFASPYQSFHSNVWINQEIVCEQGHIELMTHCYFDNCSFIIDGTPFADLTALQLAIPTACPFAQTTGANFKGDLDKLEFRSVQSNSILLGNGFQGSNIGGVNEGLVFNEANVVSTTNITFVGGNITLTNPLINGEIVWEDAFSKVVSNPFLHLNGVPDFVNNIIRTVQVPDPINPRKTTVQIETKDKLTPYETIQTFRTNYKLGEDQFGVYSGEDDYHEVGLQNLRVFGVKVTMTVIA